MKKRLLGLFLCLALLCTVGGVCFAAAPDTAEEPDKGVYEAGHDLSAQAPAMLMETEAPGLRCSAAGNGIRVLYDFGGPAAELTVTDLSGANAVYAAAGFYYSTGQLADVTMGEFGPSGCTLYLSEDPTELAELSCTVFLLDEAWRPLGACTFSANEPRFDGPYMVGGNIYATMEEALAAASEETTFDPESGCSFHQIFVLGDGVVEGDLTLEKGYEVYVLSGAGLTVTGELVLAQSSYEYWLTDAGKVIAELGAGLSVNGRTLTDRNGNGIFRPCPGAEVDGVWYSDGYIYVSGVPLDVDENEPPFLFAGGVTDIVNPVTFEDEYFKVVLQGLQTVMASVSFVGDTRLDVRGMTLVTEGGALLLNQPFESMNGEGLVLLKAGGTYRDDPEGQALVGADGLIEPEAGDGNFLVLQDAGGEDGWTVGVRGKAYLRGEVWQTILVHPDSELVISEYAQGIRMNRLIVSGGIVTNNACLFNEGRIELNPFWTDEESFLLGLFENNGTVENRGELCVNENAALRNSGDLYNYSWFEVEGVFRNEGSFENLVEVIEETAEGFRRVGYLDVNGGSLFNSGYVLTSREESDEYYEVCTINVIGGAFINEENGVFANNGAFYMEPAGGQTICRGNESRRGSEMRAPVFENYGSIENGTADDPWSDFGVVCNDAVNAGRIDNYGNMSFRSVLMTDVEVTLERRVGVPQSDEEWDAFWGWDIEHPEEEGYLVAAEETVTAVEVPDGLFRNEAGGQITNRGDLHLESVELTNDGEIVNFGYLNVANRSMTDDVWWDAGNELEGVSFTPAVLVNNSNVRNAAEAVGGEAFCGEMNFDSGAVLINNGSIQNEGITEWEDEYGGPYARIGLYGAEFVNQEGAQLVNQGGFQVSAGQGYTEILNGERHEQRTIAMSAFCNNGFILNDGPCAVLAVDCHDAENNGRIENNATLDLNVWLAASEVEEIEVQDDEWNTVDWYVDSVQLLNGVFRNAGTIENTGDLHMNGTQFMNSGTLLNERFIYLQSWDIRDSVWWDAGDELEGLSFPPAYFENTGYFENREYGEFHQNGGSMLNAGAGDITNLGYIELWTVDYSQTVGTALGNDSELHIAGGSLTVPIGSSFESSGSMSILDRYGFGEETGVCDLSGFEGFYLWNQGDPNLSCYFDAEAFGDAGFAEAEAEQALRSGTGKAYGSLSLCGDITVDGETAMSAFRWYGLQWYWVDGYEDDDGWHEGYDTPSTLTVNGTLTVARETGLSLSGYHDGDRTCGAVLTVAPGGTLVVESGAEDEWDPETGEQTSWYIDCGSVNINVESSFMNEGTVDNEGYFEVQWQEGENGAPEHYGALIGMPDNAVKCIRLHSTECLTAAANAFDRIDLEDWADVTLNGWTDIPDIYVPGLAILRTAEGNQTLRGVLRVEGQLFVEDVLIVSESGRLELSESGSLFGNNGLLEVYGTIWNVSESIRNVNVMLCDGARVENDAQSYLPVEMGCMAAPSYVRHAVFRGDTEIYNQSEEIRIELEDCVFEGELKICYDGNISPVEVDFFNNASCGRDIVVMPSNTEAPDQEWNAVRLRGAAGLVVQSSGSNVQVSCSGGRGTSCILDNVLGAITEGEGEFSMTKMRETRDDGLQYRVFQVDADSSCMVMLSDYLGDVDELRLQQGRIDISQLEVFCVEIRVNDEFQPTYVKMASDQEVFFWDGYNPVDEETGEMRCCGVTLEVAEGSGNARIHVQDAQMEYRDGYYCTGVTVIMFRDGNSLEYSLNPHIFGTIDDRTPGVYVGTADPSPEYALYRGDGLELPFRATYQVDGENKTHLDREAENEWFTAGEDDDPYLSMEIRLPNGVTVIYDHVPVKPEWDDPNA